jgi:branched-chain amino acid transport system ATP-binding protein
MTLLEVEGLFKRFGGVMALTNLSFEVDSGRILGVIGPNGAGKTTLFNCVSGLDSPTGGSVRFNGVDLLGMPGHRIVREGIARTFQTARLFGRLSVLENVMVARHIHSRSTILYDLLRWPRARREEGACRDKAVQYLELVRLHKLADRKADQLTLSQARHLELARALATEPKLLLLDEPCAGMDESERQDLCRLLIDIQRLGVTLMVIEHDIEVVVNLCSEVIVLNFGRLIAQGSPEDVQRHEEVLAAYLGDELD